MALPKEDWLDVPTAMRRSSKRGLDLEGRMDTALELLDQTKELTGIGDFSDIRFLDIGCGDRFTTTFINLDIAVREYHGVDVNKDVIDYFRQTVTREGFSHAYIDAHNEMYNPGGEPLQADTDIGATDRQFDLIGLYSVFTHLAPQDWLPMLGIAQKHAAPDAKLFFTAFVRGKQKEDFVDEVPEKPLLYAAYSRPKFEEIMAQSGWEVDRMWTPKPLAPHRVVCSLRS